MIRHLEKSWLTPSEAAVKFNVGLQTVYHWIYSGQLELLDVDGDPTLPVTSESLKTKFHIKEDSISERVKRPWGPGIGAERRKKK